MDKQHNYYLMTKYRNAK